MSLKENLMGGAVVVLLVLLILAVPKSVEWLVSDPVGVR